jgi:hypothetical protein
MWIKILNFLKWAYPNSHCTGRQHDIQYIRCATSKYACNYIYFYLRTFLYIIYNKIYRKQHEKHTKNAVYNSRLLLSCKWWTVQMIVILDSMRKFLHLQKQMFFIDDTTPVREYNLKTTLYTGKGISVRHAQSCLSIKQNCTVYGISLYTCKYSHLCSLKDQTVACTSKHFYTILYCRCDSLINKQHIITRHFVDVYKILQLVTFAAAVIILEMFGTEALHFKWWTFGIIMLKVDHLQVLCVFCSNVLCDSYCLMFSSLFPSVYMFQVLMPSLL